jgi:hypothetical protein
MDPEAGQNGGFGISQMAYAHLVFEFFVFGVAHML